MKGWIAFHRKTLESIVWTDPILFRLWMLCLSKAAHRENHKFIFNGLLVPIEVGQFITGRQSIAEEYNKGLKSDSRISESKAWRLLKKLEKLEMLNIKSTTKYSVISITNWTMYQNFEQQSEQRLNNKPTTSEQQTDTNNNVNNKDNDNNVFSSYTDKNNKYNNAYEMYELAYPKKPLNQFIAQSIAAWINDFGGQVDIVSYAIEQAGMNAASTPKYFETILKAWEKKGIRTLNEAIKNTEQFEALRDKELEEKIAKQQIELEMHEQAQQPIPKVTMHNWLDPEDD